MKRSILILILTLAAVWGWAQELTVHAPTTVTTGQRFQVRYEIDEKANNFRGPTFKGLSVLSGPSTSSSSSTSWINGQVTRNVSTGFNYLIQADQVGTFNIGPASCSVNGKKYTCQGFTIKVEKGDPNQQQQQQSRHQGYSQQQYSSQPSQTTEITSDNLFARASISKSNPYQGEQIIVTYKIYTQVPISQFQIDKLPGNKGFWSEDLSEGKEIKQYEETLHGKTYQVAEIRKGAMFAQESGKIKIAPLNLDVLAMVQRKRQRTGTIWDLFDDPFFSSAQAVEKHLTTNAVTVNVKPLPTAPEGYCGGVGNFNVTANTDLTELRANEAVTYSITISGSGNLMLINAPQIEFPQVFEVYDPETIDKINHGDNGISGSRTFQWVIIPRSEGKYEIPAVEFSFFNPQTGHYVTKKLNPIKLKVHPGDPKAMQNISSKSDVKVLNNDINHIKSSAKHLVKVSNFQQKPVWLHQTPAWYYCAIIILIIATIALLIIGKRKEAQDKDIAGTRLRRATKEARKRLKKAAAYLNSGDDEKFYEEIYKAIWGSLADKFNIELSQLSGDTVQSCLQEKHVAPEQEEHILKTLHDVDFARFAPGDKSARKQQIYDEALEMIATL